MNLDNFLNLGFSKRMEREIVFAVVKALRRWDSVVLTLQDVEMELALLADEGAVSEDAYRKAAGSLRSIIFGGRLRHIHGLYGDVFVVGRLRARDKNVLRAFAELYSFRGVDEETVAKVLNAYALYKMSSCSRLASPAEMAVKLGKAYLDAARRKTERGIVYAISCCGSQVQVLFERMRCEACLHKTGEDVYAAYCKRYEFL